MFETAAVLLTVFLLQNPSLDSPRPQDRLDAIEEMTRPGARENIPALAAALKKEPRREVRAAIVSGLARIQSPDVVPVLAETLRADLEKDVRLQAIDSLQRLYIPVVEDTGRIRTIFNRVKSVFAEPDRPVVGDKVLVDVATRDALAAAMQTDFNQEVRAAAARALGSLKTKDQVPVLIATLENPQNRQHKAVRLEIIQSLGLMRDPAAGPALERVLSDTDDQIVAEAVSAIGLTGYTAARPQVENLFRNSSNRVIRRNSLQALALMMEPSLTSLFEALLSHSDDVYRQMAAEGLARVDYDAPGLKVRITVEEKANARNAVAFALASAGHDEYINDLANALDSRLVNQAEAYLYELGKFKGKLPELHRYLQSSNPKVRAGMARVLGDIGDSASSAPLEALRQDPDLEVLREATAALRRMGAQ